ncbi:MAG: hypothetical protein KKG09_00650 [Verrucomicrobia bacterium]|nr:hypothetical protein [Verrucomicrobiota bacterium]MCG2678513.1 hypothetical protein [Kiritimatiellia bacterium]MBU4248019.1 hypothetical protein [Verrucomicrobiota bacterium]MBU4289543.1 hypothetical protein [Verrucomicrobiota bacterium]MBU4427758.1 hypothetical protein [Verrucomicrobiota bacterium]
MLTKLELQRFAKQARIDIVGVAAIERFDELPPEKHPRVIFPEVKSVIVIGRRITRGTLRGVEEGSNFQNYLLFGDDWLDNRSLAMATFMLSEFIEDNGWEAVPLQNLPPEVPPMGVKVRPNQPPPNVMLDFNDAAVRAGVGELGYCGVLLTPQYGPRQRIQLILTDAPLDPDPMLADPICKGNTECQGTCPLNAYQGETQQVIAGKKMTMAVIDYSICAACKNGAHPNRYHPSGKPDRLAAVCIRNCITCLEKSNRIGNRFKTPFRTRDAWVIKNDVDLYKI